MVPVVRINTDENKLPEQTEAEKIAAEEAAKAAALQPKNEAPHIPIDQPRPPEEEQNIQTQPTTQTLQAESIATPVQIPLVE